MEGIKIPIGAPLEQLNKDLTGANIAIKKSVSQLEIQLKSYQAVAKKSFDPAVITAYNTKIQATQAELSRLGNVGKAGFDSMGNAVEKTTNGLSRAFGGLTRLAYLLPGLGIAGIFNLAFEALGPLVKQLDYFNDKLTESGKSSKILGEALSGKEYSEAVKNVSELAINIDLAQKGLLSKERVLNQYNETIGKTTGKVNSLDEAEKALTKNGPAFIRMTLLKASAQLALDEAAKKSFEAAQIRQRKSKDVANFGDKAKAGLVQGFFESTEFNPEAAKNYENNVKIAGAIRRKALATEADKEKNELLRIANAFQADAAKIGKMLNFDMFGGDQDGKAPKKPKVVENFRDAKLVIERTGNSLDTFLAKYRETESLLTRKPLIPFPADTATKLAEPFKKFELNILPQLQTSFQTFFDDILMRGKLSFDTLGKSIISTFASVLANQATTGILGLLGDKASQDKGSIFSKGAGGVAGILGKILPVAGIALAGVSLLSGLFKKKPASSAAVPAPANVASTSSFTQSNDSFGGRVVFEISGNNLIGVLNRAGAELRRFGP